MWHSLRSFSNWRNARFIEHKQKGYLAHPFATEDLAQGIAWVLESRQRWQVLSSRAREKVEQEFTLKKQARRYLSVFE